MYVTPEEREARRQFARELAKDYRTGLVSLELIGNEIGVTRERVRQMIVEVDPGAAAVARVNRQNARERQKMAVAEQRREAERQRDRRCPICEDLVPFSRGGRTLTCSPACSKMYMCLRYHLDPESREKHTLAVARWQIRHSRTPSELNYSHKVLNGLPMDTHGRWIVKGTLTEEVLHRANALRRSKGLPPFAVDVRQGPNRGYQSDR